MYKQIRVQSMITISPEENSDSQKKRNVWLTILISLFLIADFISLKDFFVDDYDVNSLNSISFLAFTIVDIVFCVYLLKWKKWAFWGMSGCALFTFILNLYNGVDSFLALLGLGGILLLFGALQLKENKISGWKNLE